MEPRNNSVAYQAQTAGGAAVEGSIAALDIGAARQQLEAMGLRVMALKLEQPPKAKPLGMDELITFNEHLTRLAQAGLPVDRGLRLVARDMGSSRVAAAANAVAGAMEKGVSLEAAVSAQRGAFPTTYGPLVEAGIRSGNLPGVLLNLGRHLELAARTRRAIWQALSYPMIVGALFMCVLTFMGYVTLPKFQELYADFQTSLPTLTVLVLSAGRWMPAIGGTVLMLLLAIPLTAAMLRAAGLSGALAEAFLFPMPLVGRVLKCNVIAQWCDALRISVDGGLNLPTGMELAGQVVDSKHARHDGQQMIDTLSAGRSLEDLPTLRIMPALVPTTIALASAKGELAPALGALAELYEEQGRRRAGVLTMLITPAIMVVMALLAVTTIVALFLPLYRLLDSGWR